jgi:hypothetical protein
MTRGRDAGIMRITMEIGFTDPDQAPLPPEDTHILSLAAAPSSGGQRVDVHVKITPFQQRPNLHVCIYDERGKEVASVGAIQILQTQLGFTLHLRQPETTGRYMVRAYLIYPDIDLGVVDEAETGFHIE